MTLKEVVDAVAASNSAAGGHVITKGNAEYVVRGVGWLGASSQPGDTSLRSRAGRGATWRTSRCQRRDGRHGPARRGRPGLDRARASAAASSRRTATRSPAAWCSMAHGENPLEVTRRLKAKIRELQPGLPAGRARSSPSTTARR